MIPAPREGGRRILFLVGSILLLDTMFFTALTPLLPHYAAEVGLSKTGAGLLQAAYPAGAFVAGIPSGILAARAGVKRCVLVGLAGMVTTTFTFSLADSAWLLDGARFLQGASSSCAWTGGFAWLVAATPAARRSRTLGSAWGAVVLGGLLGPVLGAIASLAGSVEAFGGVGLIVFALGIRAVRTPAERPEETQGVGELFAAFGDRRVLLAVWFVSLPALLFGALSVLAPLKLASAGLGAVAIGAVFLASGVFEALLSPLLGRVIDRVGTFRPMQAGLAAAAIVTAVLPWPSGKWLLAAAVTLTGVSFGAFWVPAFTLLTQRSEARGLDLAYAFALMNVAWAPGQGLGAAVGGAAGDAAGDALPYLTLTVLCLVSFLALRPAHPAAVPEGAT